MALPDSPESGGECDPGLAGRPFDWISARRDRREDLFVQCAGFACFKENHARLLGILTSYIKQHNIYDIFSVEIFKFTIFMEALPPAIFMEALPPAGGCSLALV